MSRLAGRDRPSASPGFTLTELLVVIALVSLLMAILLPALSKVRVLAQRTCCASNARQLAVAWNQYLHDNNERFLQGINANVYFGGWRGMTKSWPRPLNPYFFGNASNLTEQEARVFGCPADGGGADSDLPYEQAYRVNGNSYQTNTLLIGPFSLARPFNPPATADLDKAISDRLAVGLKATSVTSPPQLLLLLGDNGWVGQWKPARVNSRMKELAEWHGAPDRHNVAFLDGHVKYQEIQKGYYAVEGKYTVLPFQDLVSQALRVQGPAP